MHQFAQAWLGLIVDISIKSLGLAVLAGLALFVLRVRDTNLRHRVWTAVLFGMLAMPALVFVTPVIPLPRWMNIAIPEAKVEASPVGDIAYGRPVTAPPRGSTDVRLDSIPLSTSGSDAFRDSAMNRRMQPAQDAPQTADTNDLAKKDPIALKARVARQPSVAVQIASRLPVVLASLYFAVAAIFGARLLVGFVLTYRLIRQARQMKLPAISASPRRNIRFLESELIHVPATVGFLRPVVLLPASWRQWSETKLQAVLAHELAHVRRADWLVITLAELNRAIYWFHPLAWFLRRRLSELAELNCDDAVLEAEGDRTQYACYLLEVAASLTAAGSRYRPPLSGVAMARKPNVETRIDAILDASRPLARRLGTLSAITLLLTGSTAILLAAAIRTSADDAPKKPAAVEMEMKAPAKSEGANARAKESTAQKSRPTGKAAGSSADKQYHVHGRVLDPDGKPVAGATVYAAWGLTGRSPFFARIEDKIVARTQSDAQGNYELSFLSDHPDPTRMSTGWKVVACGAGFGPAWQRDVDAFKNSQANAPTTFTLPKDQTVDGRFVDLEGNPLAGIHVRVYALKRPENGRSVAEWIADAKKKSPPQNPGDYFYPGMDAGTSPFPAPFPAKWDDGVLANGSLALPSDAVTDREGRVHFDGLGTDQLVIFDIEGPSIAKSLVQVVARDMQPISAQPSERIGLMAGTYYGREFQFVAGPTQPIVGKVTDAETGDPLANVDVAIDRIAGNLGVQTDLLIARTDDQGRYQIVGAPRGGGHYVKLEPTLDQPYFPTGKELKPASGFDPITCDFSLRRGRWITGKITDHDLKAPIAGAGVEYLPLRDNEHAKNYSNYDPNITGHTPSDRYHTAEDGSFRVLAIPGRGILAGIAERDVERRYISLNKETAPKHLVKADGSVNTYHPWTITGYHVLAIVDIAESNETTRHDLEFTRGLTRTVKVVDVRGEPVKGVRVLGRTFPPNLQQPLTDSSIEVVGLRPNDKRDVVFIHPERKIGKVIIISPGDAITVTLEPCAIARGRVVNDDGQPVRNLAVKVTVKDLPDNWNRELSGATTGEDGRFEVFLPPGTTFRVWHYTIKPQTFDISAECRAEAGAVFELGDLANGTKLKTEQTEKMIVKERTPTAQESRPTGDDTRAANRSTIHGHITGVDGKPAAGADVAVIAWRKAVGRGGDSEPLAAILAETKTDGEGRFRIERAGVSSKTHRDANVIARASGTALAWRTLNLDTADVEVSFELQPEEAISGRLVDLEGQPAAGVNLKFTGLTRRVGNDQSPTEYVGGDFSITHLPAPFPQAIVSDAQGRFVVHGVPKNHSVGLYLEGHDRFATQELSLNTGTPEQRGERDGSYRSLVKNVKPGEEAVLVLAPAQIFTGTVRYEDTGEPAPLARLKILSAQQKWGGMLETGGRADENGRYRISPRPGTYFVVWAYPPDHTPYFMRQIRFIPWEEAARSKVVDVTLPRGVLVKGKVVEQGSDAPIAGACVQYIAGAVNRTDKTIAGFPTMRLTDERGQFEIAVPSGPGNIVVRAPRDEYVFQETSDGELIKGRLGGERKYAHGVERIDPAPNSAPISLDFHLKRGSTVRGELVDTKGAPIQEAVMISRLNVNVQMMDCNAVPVKVTGGRFEISCLAPDREYPIHFLDAKRRLGATVVIKAGMTPPRVVLEPCGAATMRFVDQKGEPIAKCEPSIHLVLTPGRFDHWSLDSPLAADTVFAANVDRVNYSQPTRTDDHGSLMLSALIPGATYHIEVNNFVLSKEFKATARETIDLGDLIVEKLKSAETAADGRGASLRHGKSSIGETRRRSGSTIHGRIVGVDGKPAAGVDVAAIGQRVATGRGGDLETMGAVLGETKSDSDGQYRIELAGVSSKTHRYANVIARASGTALVWRKLNLDAADVEASFELQPENTISGRLVDIEGQPAAGVRFLVSSMTPRVITDQWPPEGITLWRWFNNLRLPTAWPAPLVTDGEGRFVIHGVPKDHGVSLEVEGNDRFAPQDVSLNTGMAEQRGERDGTYRPLIKNFKPGEEAVLPLAPAQLFTGTVRYDDTGEPAPHARLTIWASQQKFGSMISVAGKADDNGRYKISPSPGIRFGVTAYPPDGAQYLVVQKGDIPWDDGARSKVVDMRLPRGVFVQGKVLEEGSESAIAGASVQYVSEEANNRHYADHILTGWQDIHLTDKEGRFSIVVLPGPGRLLVHGPSEEFVLQETSELELYKGRPGGRRNYAHAIQRIEPAPNATPLDFVVRLKRGAAVRGELVDRQGAAIEEAEMFFPLHINAASLYWRGFAVEAKNGRFEIAGLAADRECPVSFLDSKRRLGATLMVKAGMPPPRIVLEPCGAAKMRFVDDKGKPVADYEPTIQLVMTPGSLQYDRAAMDAGSLAADADFISNVDRPNHSRPEKADDRGRLTVAALIPGASYRVVTYRKEKFELSKDFKAVANETIDLGDITVERREK